MLAYTTTLSLGLVPTALKDLEWWIHFYYPKSDLEPAYIWLQLISIIEQTPNQVIAEGVLELFDWMDDPCYDKDNAWNAICTSCLRFKSCPFYVCKAMRQLFLMNSDAADLFFQYLKEKMDPKVYATTLTYWTRARMRLKEQQ